MYSAASVGVSGINIRILFLAARNAKSLIEIGMTRV
jgi:hypothetical protein